MDLTYTAIALTRSGAVPSHAGVIAFRLGNASQSEVLAPFSNDILTFDARGEVLYGLALQGNPGLTRNEFPFGQSVHYTSSQALTDPSSPRSMDVSTQGLWIGRALHRANDLSLVGRANVSGAQCRAATAAQAVCLDADASRPGSGRIAVVDSATLGITATSTYALGGLGSQPTDLIVAGPKRVALRFAGSDGSAPSIWLYTSDRLP